MFHRGNSPHEDESPSNQRILMKAPYLQMRVRLTRAHGTSAGESEQATSCLESPELSLGPQSPTDRAGVESELFHTSLTPLLSQFGDIHLLLYADDIAIIGESRMNLQKKIKILKEYLDENLMTLNESKSKIMVFRNGDVSAPNGAMKERCERQNGIKLSLLTSLQHHDGRIRVWRHRGERILNSCVMHRHTGPTPGIMVWGGIGYHSRTALVRIAGTLNSQRYISEMLEPVVLLYLQGSPTAVFQQDNARPLVARIVQNALFFVNRHIELLPWPARSPDISPIENMWSIVAQRLIQITSPDATSD
ncbi:hypothetical protein LAZ67_20000612 [Cordylochernes scorpioides]|uniref:Reverse transcriptase domain-containing protein n=1 Tax=Cordylochernes scorpioides TaxID=51811 RepID=A0ABY6LLU6_9ARAC|nr:hypothetical protein LAZ67_20000612 [Cordylochernes scorpioides]